MSSKSTDGRPRRAEIFISATSADLGKCRQLIRDAVLKLGFAPVEQNNFRPDHRAVVEMLQKQMEQCDVVIHVAGIAYGGEPRQRAEGEPRRSYTQLEYDIARAQGKRVYTFVCDKDFPYENSEGKPYSEQQPEDDEKRLLQEAHRRNLLGAENLRYRVRSSEDVELHVLRLQAAILEYIEQAQRRDRARTTGVLAGVFAILAIGLTTLFIFRTDVLSRLDPDREYIGAYSRNPSELGSLAVQACEQGRLKALEALAKLEGAPTALRGPDKEVLDFRINEIARRDPSGFESCKGDFLTMGWNAK